MCRYILFVGVCLLTILTLCMSNNPTKVAVAYCNEDGQFLSNDIVERNTNQFLEPITEDLPPDDELVAGVAYNFNTRNTGDTYVQGTLQWEDDNGNIHPLRRVKVEVCDYSVSGVSSVMGVVYTNNNGYYSFVFENDTGVVENGGMDPYIKVYPGTDDAMVDKDVLGTKYWIEYDKGEYMNVSTGSTTTINGDIITMSSYEGQAFQISQALLTARDFAWVMMGEMPDDVSLRYPGNDDTGCYYDTILKRIHITDAINYNYELKSYASWDVIMHEYGHHIQNQLDINESNGGWHMSDMDMIEHYLDDDADSCGGTCARHKLAGISVSDAKHYGIRIAWAESWPSVFGAIAQNYYSVYLSNIETANDSLYQSYNDANYSYDNNNAIHRGEGCERSVMAVLWDIYDGTMSSELSDKISLSYQEWWDITTHSSVVTMSDFVQRFYQVYPEKTSDLGVLLANSGIAPSNVNQISSVSLTSTPPTFTWVANGGNVLLNNSFVLKILNHDKTRELSISTSATSVTLTTAQWNTVLAWYGENIYVSVIGSQTNTPTTGGYESEEREYTKPIYKTSVDSTSAKILGTYYSLSGIVELPATINGKPVVAIGDSAFANQDEITEVIVPSTLTTIGAEAFYNCTSLTTVDLSATGITRIEELTFSFCVLGEFEFPLYLEYVGAGAFAFSGNIGALPDSVTCIDEYAFAFREDALGLYLPDELFSIGDYAFANCVEFILTNEDTSLTIVGDYAFANTKMIGTVHIPASVTTIGDYAYQNSGFPVTFALRPNNLLTTIGHGAFNSCDITRIVLPLAVTTIGNDAFANDENLTIYTEHSSKPSSWSSTWNSSNRPVVWGCTLSADKSYVVSFTKSATNPSNATAVNGITSPNRKGYSFGGWYATADFTGTQYNDIASAPNGTLYAKWVEEACVVEGTMITLADGSQKAVEDLTGNEQLLVWNMQTGQFESAPILFIDSEPAKTYEVICLRFADGTEVEIVDEHGFWNVDLNQYVYLRSDALKYIGNKFNKQIVDELGNMTYTEVELIGVNTYYRHTTAWSPVTYGHLCYYVNGMLSMPGATSGLVNIFEVDAENMIYDEELMQDDIEKYGVFSYEEFYSIVPVPEEMFDAVNGQYLKVAIGKGLISINDIVKLAERYAPYFMT